MNYSLFNEEAQDALKTWVIKALHSNLLTHKELFQEAIQFLKAKNIIPPSKAKLGRFLSTEKQKAIIYSKIISHVTEKQKSFMTQLIQVDKNETYSKLHYYKRSPPDPKARDLLEFICRFNELEEAEITKIKIDHVSPQIVDQLANLTKCYDVRALRRIQPENKRYALLICFLVEASQTLLDHIIYYIKKLCRKAKEGLKVVLRASRKLLTHTHPDETTLTDFYQVIGKEKTEAALHACEELCEYDKVVSILF